jgi:hypothetical protein
VIYVYGIGERDNAGIAGEGIDDLPVEAVEFGDLCAFVSRGVEGGIDPASRALWRHEAVVEALMMGGALLPMRFGTVLEGDDALGEILEERRSEFSRALARVRDRVEIGVRALWVEAAPAGTPTSGRAYLSGKLQRRHAAQSVADDLHLPFSELAAAATCRLLPDDDAAFTAAYLVDRAHMHELERRVEQLGSRRGDVDVVCTGPWPPYSFSNPADD